MNDSENLAPVTHVRVKKIPSPEQLQIPAQGNKINVIGVTEGTVITQTLQLTPKVENGLIVPDPERDIAKIVVLERHRDTGRFGVGFVKGLGVRRGAFGSSVAHDAHNFVVAGADDFSIVTALKGLAEIGGGLVTADGQNLTASFPLPIGGLMSYLQPEEVSAELAKMERAASDLGVRINHPFMVMSFLCLSVIPELRITDLGYVDITKGGVQKIFA